MAILSHRMVPDPFLTDSQFYHERASNPGKPNIGKVLVHENLTTRIGGLAYVKDRLAHHEMTAERFKSEYEALYGSGNPAMDTARVQVDTSPVAHDSGMAGKVDRGRDLKDAMEALGKESADLVIAVVVLCIPIRDIAPTTHWRARKKTTGELLMALDSLAVRWGYVTRPAWVVSQFEFDRS